MQKGPEKRGEEKGIRVRRGSVDFIIIGLNLGLLVWGLGPSNTIFFLGGVPY